MPRGKTVFKTDRKIRLGIWGLGRGMSFYRSCKWLNIDVVAGCDYNKHMRKNFLARNPGAFVTDDATKFLDHDMDAVLVATFCPAHASDAIACLHAGKHVLSEVTAFHTMSEGVALVEEVERSGLVYNLAENYPFMKANMWLAAKWREGLFGELMYAEYEYVHECRPLQYTYIDGVPIKPGNTVHNWRSWLSGHYYCTHSLGPVMVITGTRPVRVTALRGTQTLPGYVMQNVPGRGGIAPQLIEMDNGAIVRNLMGATTNDSHQQRLYGVKGSAEIIDWDLRLRLGAKGMAPKMSVEPEWPMLADLAGQTGHGGGDFWCLYYFARQILTGEKAPFDIYEAADVTIPGILAYRSAMEDGKPYTVPDFRNRAERNSYRRDKTAQKRYDAAKGVFPKTMDPKTACRFSTIMPKLLEHATRYRAYVDWVSVADSTKDKSKIVELADELIAEYGKMQQVIRAARKMIKAAPRSDGARVLKEMLDVADEKTTMQPGFIKGVKKVRNNLKKRKS